MPYQSAVTLRAALRPTAHDDAARALAELESAIADGSSEFNRLSGVHYARFSLLPETTLPDGTGIAESLLYLADVDGSERAHLRGLARRSPGLIEAVLACCEGFPGDSADRRRWLREHRLGSAAGYVNTVGRGAQQILDEARLYDQLQAYLDTNGAKLTRRTALEWHRQLRGFVGATASLTFAISPPAKPPLWWRARSGSELAAALVLLALASPILLLALPFWLVALRRHERHDVVFTEQPDPAMLERLRAQEDRFAYNPFLAVGAVRPGRFRRITVVGVLWAIKLAARHVFNHESLAGVTTIHFARWVYLDDRRRVFFASNYDGSLESYMDDFIDKVAWGLNAVFSNGLGFPRTRWLLLDGARQEQLFKNYLRCHQLPAQASYSAYPALSAANVNNNAEVRLGLTRSLTEDEAAQWLARL